MEESGSESVEETVEEEVGGLLNGKRVQLFREGTHQDTALYTKDEMDSAITNLKSLITELPKDTETNPLKSIYHIMQIKESSEQKLEVFNKLLKVNIPLLVAIPVICEYFIDEAHPKRILL